MAHFCKICNSFKANERFSGKGHKTHICKDCKSLGQEAISHIQRINDVTDFLLQSNISKNNIKTLRTYIEEGNEELKEISSLILEVALCKPHKRKRILFLSQNKPELLKQLIQQNLILGKY